jgi:hypothetical protein
MKFLAGEEIAPASDAVGEKFFVTSEGRTGELKFIDTEDGWEDCVFVEFKNKPDVHGYVNNKPNFGKKEKLGRLVVERLAGTSIDEDLVATRINGVKTDDRLENILVKSRRGKTTKATDGEDDEDDELAPADRPKPEPASWNEEREARPVTELDPVSGEPNARWESAMEASREIGINPGSIIASCETGKKLACGRMFAYESTI